MSDKSAETHDAHCPVDAPNGGIVVLPRDGRPPVRLKASLVYRLTSEAPQGAGTAQATEEAELVLAIWQRPAGGAVASIQWPVATGVRRDVVKSGTRDGLLDELETRFAPGATALPSTAGDESHGRRRSRSGRERGRASDAIARLTSRLYEEQARHRFRGLLEAAIAADDETSRG